MAGGEGFRLRLAPQGREGLHHALQGIRVQQHLRPGGGFSGAGLPLPPPGAGAASHRQDREPAQPAHHQAAGAAGLPLARFGLLAAGLHKLPLRGAELMRPLPEPGLGPLELEPCEQGGGTLALRGFLPILKVLLQLLAAEQKLPIPIQPAPQQGPLAQERLMGHLQQALALLLAADQQAGLHQLLQQQLGLGRQLGPAGRATHIVALLKAHHRRHEGLPQRCCLRLAGAHRLQHRIGAAPHSIFQGRQAGLGIAQGLVGRQAERTIRPEALHQLPQGKGQQGQGILRFGVSRGLPHEGLLHGQPRHLGGPLDDRRDLGQRQGRQRHLLKAGRQALALSRLKPAEEIRAKGHHHQKGQIARQRRRENAEEAPRLFWLLPPEELLPLIDRQQDLRLVRRGRHAQISGDLRQHGRQRSTAIALHQGPVQGSPIGGAASGEGQGPRQLLAGLPQGPKRWHQAPPPPGTPQAGQHPGPQQRRLAGA